MEDKEDKEAAVRPDLEAADPVVYPNMHFRNLHMDPKLRDQGADMITADRKSVVIMSVMLT